MTFSPSHTYLDIYRELNELHQNLAPDRQLITVLEKYPTWDVNEYPSQIDATKEIFWRPLIYWRFYTSEFLIYYLQRGGKLNFSIKRERNDKTEIKWSIFHSVLQAGLNAQNIEAFHYILDHHAHEINWVNENCTDFYIDLLLSNTHAGTTPIFLKKILDLRPQYFTEQPRHSHILINSYNVTPFADQGHTKSDILEQKNYFYPLLNHVCDELCVMIEYGLSLDNSYFKDKMLPQFLNIDSSDTNYCVRLMSALMKYQGIEKVVMFFNQLIGCTSKISGGQYLSIDELVQARFHTIQRCFESMASAADKKLVYLATTESLYMLHYIFSLDCYFLDFERKYRLTTDHVYRIADQKRKKIIKIPLSLQLLITNAGPGQIEQLASMITTDEYMSEIGVDNQLFLKKYLNKTFDKAIDFKSEIPGIELVSACRDKLNALQEQRTLQHHTPQPSCTARVNKI